MYSGENYIPDFNLIDYAISPYPVQFGDRAFHLPACVWPRDHWQALPQKDRNYSSDILNQKPYFANFIVVMNRIQYPGGFLQEIVPV